MLPLSMAIDSVSKGKTVNIGTNKADGVEQIKHMGVP
jgi:hypothetical protein